jgi:hypothetical protein
MSYYKLIVRVIVYSSPELQSKQINSAIALWLFEEIKFPAFGCYNIVQKIHVQYDLQFV